MEVPVWQGGISQGSKPGKQTCGQGKKLGTSSRLEQGQVEGSQGEHLRTGPRGGNGGRGDSQVTEAAVSWGEMGQR